MTATIPCQTKKGMTREEIVEGLKLLEDNMVYFDELQNDKGEWIDIHELLFEAIQALSQEPCTDAVSRAEVKKIVDFYTEQYDGIFHVNESIDKLPSVTQKSEEWIPVSERLPESDEEYHTFLVTDSKGRVTLSEFYLSISDRKPYWSGMIEVIAWMPWQHMKLRQN